MSVEQVDCSSRFELDFDRGASRRRIAEMEVIIHCHHYNSRVQRTVEGCSSINGKAIILEAAEAVFLRHMQHAFAAADDEPTKWNVAEQLYAHLGYGALDTTRRDEGLILGKSSHFVEGWRAAFAGRPEPVCTLTEGYLQAAYAAISNRPVYVREERCMLQGAPHCQFRVDANRTTPLSSYAKRVLSMPAEPTIASIHSANVDEEAIVNAVAAMPHLWQRPGPYPGL